MAQRRIMTEADKRAYAKKASGKLTLSERISQAGKKKKIVVSTLIGLVLFLLVGYVIYENVRPTRIKDVIGSDYAKIEWSSDSSFTADQLKQWSVERTFPGSLGDNASVECQFFNNEGKYVGSVTFLGHDNLFIYEGEVYIYKEPNEYKESKK